MRHLLYWLLLGGAVIVALISSLPFMMTECQLHQTRAEADACAGAGYWALRVYGVGLVSFVIVSLVLYTRKDRWTWISLLGVVGGPSTLAVLWSICYRLL